MLYRLTVEAVRNNRNVMRNYAKSSAVWELSYVEVVEDYSSYRLDTLLPSLRVVRTVER